MDSKRQKLDELKVAFVGSGAVNFGGAEGPWDHSRRLEQLGGVRFVAIVDPLVEKAGEVLRNKLAGPHSSLYADCRVVGDVKELATMDPELRPDVAFIGVPPFCHGSHQQDMELQLVRAGIHVFIEKPISVLPPEEIRSYVETVTKEAKERNVIISVGYMFRYHGAIEKMKEIVSTYQRPLLNIRAGYNCAYAELDHPFWWNKSRSGGPIVEQATHMCDLLRYFGGEVDTASLRGLAIPASDDASAVGYLSAVPKNVREDKLAPENRIPRLTTAHWQFACGTVGSLTHGVSLHCQRYEATLEVWADGLRMLLEDPYFPECKLRVRRGYTNEEEVINFPDEDPYYREDEMFLSAVRSGDATGIRSSYEDAFDTYKLTWAIRNASSKD